MVTTEQASDVIATRQGPVTLLTLNRPDRRNALTPAVQQRLDSLLREADADPACRAIVITGAGRAFCAGADLDVLRSGRDAVSAVVDPPAEAGG